MICLYLMSTAPQAHAAGANQDLGPGVLLVATSHMTDSRFAQAVILIVKHAKDGALGVIINKRSGIDLDSLDSELGGLSDKKHFTYFGGPVHIQHMSYVHQNQSTNRKDHQVFNDIYWGTDLNNLKQLLPITDDDSLRLFFGYAGWAPRQLEFEVSLGHWRIIPADATHIFSKDVKSLWRKLSNEGSGLITRIVLPEAAV